MFFHSFCFIPAYKKNESYYDIQYNGRFPIYARIIKSLKPFKNA